MDRVAANRHHLLVLWFFALATGFLCSTLYAQTPIVDQSNLPVWTGGWTNVQEGNNVTQTFTPQFSTLTGVDIDLVTGNPQYGADVVTVEILRGTAPLVSISQLVSPGFEGLLHLDYSAPIPTNPGETLKLVVKDTTLTIGWKYGLNTYAGGMYIHHGVSRPEFDFFFQTYGYPAPCDFNGDGKSDILWRHRTTGEVAAWYMNRVNFISSVGIAMVDSVWEIVGTPDLNGDRKPDFLWRHKTTGELAAWYMNGLNFISPVGIATVDPIWKLVGTPDLNRDGKADFLWRHKTTGELAAWYMNGVNFIAPVGIATVDPIWELVGTPDLNSDGKADFLWRHKTTGELAAWYMNGVNFISPVGIATVNPIWELVGTPDLNSDGKADFLWRHKTTGELAVWYMNGVTFISPVGIATVDPIWEVVAPK